MIHELFAYLCVSDSAKAIEYYGAVFGATEKFRLTEPGGRIGHAELDFGGYTVLLADEFPECGFRSPLSIGGTPVTIHLHVDNADAIIERAPKDEFYGERSGVVCDPFGHRWNIGHSIEKVSTEEMQRRYNALLEA